MEEYTNRELGLLLQDISKDVKRLSRCIEGNGKKGLLERATNIETWQKINEPAINDLVNTKKRTIRTVLDVVYKVAIAVVLTTLGLGKYYN